jgi:uncharacterized protein YegL
MSSIQLFTEQTILFNDQIVDKELVPSPIIDAKFGILNLTAISAPLCQEDYEFIFMVDCSGSMSDECSDGRAKIQHIVHTLKNMILYFKENPNIKVHITINSFDDKINNVFKRTNVTEENYSEIISKVNAISPRGSTNIELALKQVSALATQIKTDFPTHTICNVFMTDGEVTDGEVNHNNLSQLVDKTIRNYFIGFGIEHDAMLLNSISNNVNSAYYFIDKLENAGLVYGEILHGIVYKYITNGNISVENGLIYDYKNNIWVANLCIGDIVSESIKIYHIVSNNHTECIANLTGVLIADKSNIQIIIHGQPEFQDLTKYIYRQRTLQLLYKVNDFLKRKNEPPAIDITIDNSNSIFNWGGRRNLYNDHRVELKEEEATIKTTLRTFIEEMKKYMVQNNMDDDKIMKSLCDDIYISYKTFNTKYGTMYVASRQTSNGNQRCYNVSHTPENDNNSPSNKMNSKLLRMPVLSRDTNNAFGFNQYDDLLLHEVSCFEDSPYLTRGASETMRDISIGSPGNEDSENADDN